MNFWERSSRTRVRLIGLGLSTLIWSCSASKPEDPAVESKTTSALQTANADKDQAVADQVDVFSPANFDDAVTNLDKANKLHEKGENSVEVMKYVSEFHSYLDKAQLNASKSKGAVPDIAEARKNALTAGASKFDAERLATADSALRSASSKYEKSDDTSKLMETRPKILNTYLDVELKSIETAELGKADEDLATAKHNNAEDIAPITYGQATTAMSQARSAFESGRHSAKARDLAQAARRDAAHAVAVTQAARKIGGPNAETMVLQDEASKGTIAHLQTESANKEAALEESKRAEADNAAKLNAQNAQLTQTQKDLAVETDLNRKFAGISSMFLATEADVFRDGRAVIIRAKGVGFKSGKSSFDENSAMMKKVSDAVAVFDPISVRVEGHTDNVGSDKVNQALSVARAEAVASFLKSHTLKPDVTVETAGFGASKPVGNNKIADGRAQNRRIDIIMQPRISPELSH